jgi:hypothetical protein
VNQAREYQREQRKAGRNDDKDDDWDVGRNHLYRRKRTRGAQKSGWFITRDLKGGQESGPRPSLCRKLKILNNFCDFIA